MRYCLFYLVEYQWMEKVFKWFKIQNTHVILSKRLLYKKMFLSLISKSGLDMYKSVPSFSCKQPFQWGPSLSQYKEKHFSSLIHCWLIVLNIFMEIYLFIQCSIKTISQLKADIWDVKSFWISCLRNWII